MAAIKKIKWVCLTTLILTIGLQTKSVMAEENNYESNGQASFYGTYVYENEKESNDALDSQQSEGQGRDNISATRQSEGQGRNNFSVSEQAVLPKTGESENPLYSLIGVSLLGVVIYLINKMKREKEFI
ncbi:LPXTG cell wall anchor domain-containing protein [Enterococcus faecalis]|uniref:LPXTG cell wall anchor domain-containing protein n=1 Tax=Enterococcus faecalis TaxID=1351 RepID=UPI002DB95B05|nr:LPXTG cell wall anchor domain-containing protein [Enterococcus faecalis]MEB7954591.1 LPXTG cell wall anchor domain-containing protein [Enterococcus faecalis]MEB7964743.1 LPXTG cell wall anchor domain-containing protein [Enterococcus faecalis]